MTPPEAPPTPQTLKLLVAVPPGPPWADLHVELTRLGRTSTVVLRDDGSTPEDIRLDGVYVGTDVGEYARYVFLRVYGQSVDGASALLWEGNVTTPDAWQETVAFRASAPGWESPKAERVAVAVAPGKSGFPEALPQLTAFGWGIFLLVFIGLLGVGRVRRGLAG